MACPSWRVGALAGYCAVTTAVNDMVGAGRNAACADHVMMAHS
ncbi:hypothetical protein KEM60_00818 [Austwickia sp. TVS 96-490-7B]|nr:hypothetical protein [Austwickia sp. TVS 96-490-7B]